MGVRAKDLILTLPLLGLRTRGGGGGVGMSAGVSRLKAPSGEVKNPSQVAPITRSLILGPPRRCSKFFNLNWWKGYCYHEILIMVPRGGGTGTHPFQCTLNI